MPVYPSNKQSSRYGFIIHCQWKQAKFMCDLYTKHLSHLGIYNHSSVMSSLQRTDNPKSNATNPKRNNKSKYGWQLIPRKLTALKSSKSLSSLSVPIFILSPRVNCPVLKKKIKKTKQINQSVKSQITKLTRIQSH